MPVYFAADEMGRIKIGYTGGDPLVRLKGLQTSASSILRLLATLPHADIDEEHRLHTRFGAYRVTGEWFEPVPALLDTVRSAGADPACLPSPCDPASVSRQRRALPPGGERSLMLVHQLGGRHVSFRDIRTRFALGFEEERRLPAGLSTLAWHGYLKRSTSRNETAAYHLTPMGRRVVDLLGTDVSMPRARKPDEAPTRATTDAALDYRQFAVLRALASPGSWQSCYDLARRPNLVVAFPEPRRHRGPRRTRSIAGVATHLTKLGLVEKGSKEEGSKTHNAWRLTQAGADLVRATPRGEDGHDRGTLAITTESLRQYVWLDAADGKYSLWIRDGDRKTPVDGSYNDFDAAWVAAGKLSIEIWGRPRAVGLPIVRPM